MYSRALQKEHLVGSKRIAKPAEGRVASGAHNAVAQYRGARNQKLGGRNLRGGMVQ